MITLLVDKDKTIFHVHQDLLSAVSPFFKTALSGAETLASERSMTLPNDRSSTFDQLVDWLYSQNISYDRESLLKNNSDYGRALREEYRRLIMLYLTAHKYRIVALKNDILDVLFELHFDESFVLKIDMIRYIYRHTPAGSSLRRLIIDWHVWHANPKWMTGAESQENLRRCPDFAAELVTRMFAKECGQQDPWLKSGREFYEPAEDSTEDNRGDRKGDISDRSFDTSIAQSSIGDECSSIR